MSEGAITDAPPPGTPAELAAIISQLSGVVAHRLHACILAYAFRRPIVGLGWDRKLESFFQSVGLDPCFLPAGNLTPQKAGSLLDMALAGGIDPARHAAAVAETRAAIQSVYVNCGIPLAEPENVTAT